MAKQNFFKRFVDTLRGGDIEAEDLEDRMDTPLEEVAEVPLEEAKPFTANPLAGVANMPESVFYTGSARHKLDNEHTRFIPEQYRQEHEPYRYDENGDGQVCISAANIYEIHPKNDGDPSVRIHPLKPLIISPPRNGVIYGHFETDNQGRIKSTLAGTYTLETGKALPQTIYFQLPDEDDSGGQEGDYYIPICYFKDGKTDRHQFTGGRQARLMGSLMGIRGPLIWNTGYNKLKNIGDGKNVYRSHVLSSDYKELRTIRGRRTLSNTGSDTESDDYEDPAVFCNDARIKVKYAGEDEAGFNKSAASEIVVTGNGYDKEWKCERTNIPTGESASSTRIAIIEDGLVNSVKDIPYIEYARRQIQTVPVLTTPTTGSSTTSVISEWSLRSVVNNVTVTNFSDSNSGGAWTGGTSTADNVVVSASVANDYVRGGTVNANMIQGTPHSTMWAGGTKRLLDWVQICVSSGSTTDPTCYWVLGELAAEGSSAPDEVIYVDDPTQVTGVTSAVQVTSVQDCTTIGAGVQSTVSGQGIIGTNITTSDFVTAVTTQDEDNMVKYIAGAAVPLVNSSTVNVYQENTAWSGQLLDAAQAQTIAKILEVPSSDAPKRCDNPPD
jgi:hypothetical protein